MANDLNLFTLRKISTWNKTIHQCLTMHDIGHMTMVEATTTAACILAEENKQLTARIVQLEQERGIDSEKKLHGR